MVERQRPPYDVLIVDDVASVREALALALENEGDLRVVGEARDGGEALLAAALLAPDIILLDFWLPDSTGLALIPALIGCAPDAAIVLLTVESGAHFRKEALAHGAAAYVSKTTSPPELFVTLRSLMSARGEHS